MQNSSSRIRDDDRLIIADETRAIMGGISVSTLYADPDLMGLKISMTAGDRRPHAIRWIEREVLTLRAERVARAEAEAASVRAKVEAAVERRRIRQRARQAAGSSRVSRATDA